MTKEESKRGAVKILKLEDHAYRSLMMMMMKPVDRSMMRIMK